MYNLTPAILTYLKWLQHLVVMDKLIFILGVGYAFCFTPFAL